MCEKPNGLPIATTKSPTLRSFASANGISERLSASTWTTARSEAASEPMTRASMPRLSSRVIVISAASSMTWWFVRIYPRAASTMTPEPALRKSLRLSRGTSKKRRNSGSSASGLSISTLPRTEILTTAGEARAIIGARLGNGAVACCCACDGPDADNRSSATADRAAAPSVPRTSLAGLIIEIPHRERPRAGGHWPYCRRTAAGFGGRTAFTRRDLAGTQYRCSAQASSSTVAKALQGGEEISSMANFLCISLGIGWG